VLYRGVKGEKLGIEIMKSGVKTSYKACRQIQECIFGVSLVA